MSVCLEKGRAGENILVGFSVFLVYFIQNSELTPPFMCYCRRNTWNDLTSGTLLVSAAYKTAAVGAH